MNKPRFACISIFLLSTLMVSGCGGGSSANGGGASNNALVINTVAGNGVGGYSGDGGPATSAELLSPSGVAVDGSGNFYIADTGNSVIRKVNSTGKINTIAGNGLKGYSGDGGPADSAMLYDPTHAVVDQAGNVYIADLYNNRIRKVDPSGIITTFAGTGVEGYNGDGISATSAQLNWPSAVAVDSAGNVYIVDTENQRIREVDTSGIISTIAGTGFPGSLGDGGPAVSAQVNEPEGIAVDNHGNVYIADSGNSEIRKIDTSGTINTIAGTGSFGYGGDGGPATSGILNFPIGVAVDSGANVYIADSQNNRIRKVNASGIITTFAGTGRGGFGGDGGPPSSAELFMPCDVAVDVAGSVFIADSNNMRIRKVR